MLAHLKSIKPAQHACPEPEGVKTDIICEEHNHDVYQKLSHLIQWMNLLLPAYLFVINLSISVFQFDLINGATFISDDLVSFGPGKFVFIFLGQPFHISHLCNVMTIFFKSYLEGKWEERKKVRSSHPVLVWSKLELSNPCQCLLPINHSTIGPLQMSTFS